MKSERQIKLQKHASARTRAQVVRVIVLFVSAILITIPIILTMYF